MSLIVGTPAPGLTAAERSDIGDDMKTISVSVSENDYEAFRAHAVRADRSIAELVREAMRLYRESCIQEQSALKKLTVYSRPRCIRTLPPREELYDEISSRHI